MKKKVRICPAIYPMPVILIATYNDDGTVDVMNAAWGCAYDTNQIELNISDSHRTTENIKKRKSFTVSLANLANMVPSDYVGIVSAKDVKDKIEKSGLHIEHIDGNPTFKEGKYVIVCKVLYRHQLDPSEFIEKDVCEKAYPNKDYSYMFVGEIESAWEIM